MVRALLCAGFVLLALATCQRRPAGGENVLRAEIVWDLLLEEPSGLAALADGTLLTVGDGDRGLVHRLRVDGRADGKALAVEPNWLDTHRLLHPPHDGSDKRAPDLEGIAPTSQGRLALAAEHWNEVWEVDPRLGAVTGLWRLPPMAEEGGTTECLGKAFNHGIEAVAFDPARHWLLVAHERCPPALFLFTEKSGRPVHAWYRAAVDEALGRQSGAQRLGVGSFSGLTWAGEAGRFILLDRHRRELLLIAISENFTLSLAGRWSFAGVFRERGLARKFGNAEGVALAKGKLYLVTDPGESLTAQLARFAWPP